MVEFLNAGIKELLVQILRRVYIYRHRIESLQPNYKKVKRQGRDDKKQYVSATNSLISLKKVLDRRFSQDHELKEKTLKVRIQNSLIVQGCWQGDHAVLGRAIWNYTQEVQTSGNQKAIRDSANGVIDVFDSGNRSFLDFTSSNKIFQIMNSQ